MKILTVCTAFAVSLLATSATHAQMAFPARMDAAGSALNADSWTQPRRLPPYHQNPTWSVPSTTSSQASNYDPWTDPLNAIRPVDYVASAGMNGESTTQKDAGFGKEASCLPFWAHRPGVFGEFLYLRSRDGEVSYAVPTDGAVVAPPNVPIQFGNLGVVDPDYSPGFRVGRSFCLDECTSLVATYTFFESDTFNEITIDPGLPGPLALHSLVEHPGTNTAGGNHLFASARLDIDFQFADIDYRTIWWIGDRSVVNWMIGARFAQLEQEFRSQFGDPDPLQDVITGVRFEGGGLRLGIDGERHHPCRGVLIYGRSVLNLIAGEVDASYSQFEEGIDPEIVQARWKAGRVVPIWELELGAGWQSPCGHFRLTGGYMFNMWFNTLSTTSWIRSVQQNSFAGQADAMSYDTLTFDGLNVRAEYRF